MSTPPDDAVTREIRPGGDGRPAQAADGRPPRLAEGIELVGEYQDSGYKEPPSIARRADGQVIQMSELLYIVAEEADGRRSYEEIAERVTERFKREVSADNIRTLVEEHLRPLGVLAAEDGSSPEVAKPDPLLALKYRVGVVPARATKAITTPFLPFFWPPVVLAVIAGVIAVDVYVFFVHGIGQSTRELVYNPLILLVVLGAVVLATALHEIGHATAARYGGAEPGVMGAGLYVVWPAFYTDVTDAYRLDRGGRLRTDLGGIYFNGLFILLTAGVYFATRFEPLLIIILIQHFQVVQQLLPFLRLDGYYILSDLTGVPDLFKRIKPTLKSLHPGEETPESVQALKPWVRVVVTAWVVLLVPILALMFGALIFNVPRIAATAWDSFFVQLGRVQHGEGTLDQVVGSSQLVMIALPVLGIALTVTRTGRRAVPGLWSWSEDSGLRRAAVVVGSAALVAVTAYVWYPNGEYRPIQPGERGTVQGGFDQFRDFSTGRPGLAPAREQELDGAPVVRDEGGAPLPGSTEEPGAPVGEEPADEPTPTTETGATDTGAAETGATDTGATETGATETTTTP